VAVGQGPWHSVNSDIYHNNPDCQTGGMIDPENIRPGTGGKRLCEECARLDPASGAVSAPMGDLTGEPGRDTREAATSQPSGAAYDPLAEPTVRRAAPLVAGWARKKRLVWKRASVEARGGRWTRKSKKSLEVVDSTAAK
jgi:hypothetical protein